MSLIISKKIFGTIAKNLLSSQRHISKSAVMCTIKANDPIPNGELFEDSPANKIEMADLACGKRLVIFGVPGAFTPGCSKTHLPGYVERADEIKCEQDIDEILCISVNDPFVM